MASSRTAALVLADVDVDDLDDIVDLFDPAPLKPSVSAPPATSAPIDPLPATSPTVVTTATASATSVTASSSQPDPSDHQPPSSSNPDASRDKFPLHFAESFERELAKGMESLMREMGGPAAFTDGHAENESEEQKEVHHQLRATWEAMLIQDMGGEHLDSGEQLGDAGIAGPAKDSTFQHTIQQTMEKLKKSESNLQSDTSTKKPSSNDDIESLEALLAQLGAGGEDGLPNGETEEELQGFLETMMSHLMSKEVLYEPLKELHSKFPGYLTDNASTLSDSDKNRYESQYSHISKIISCFEDPKYSEEDVETATKIVGYMSEIQSLGSPPASIMGPLPPGFGLGPDGTPQIPEGCTIA